ncbi:MAG TPA: RNA polymerase sigma factor region1.1 domain-containing protein, partial [Deltaproteobacteria bacterium]|nr:RNA polymerase sigma factor region1.1 domain-containing protein [Deltaproteobacteria bacterium]
MSDKKQYPKEVQRLIAMGKSKGFLTYDEVNDGLPDDILSPDDLDDVMDLFSEKEIQLVDTEEDFTPEEEEFDFHDDGSMRSPDPVKMYLHEMGSVSLLSREDETEIAKRIEAGQKQILNVIINSPVTVKEVIQIGSALARGEIRLKDVVDIDDIVDVDEEAVKTKTLDVIRKIEEKQGELKDLKYQLFKARSRSQKEKIKKNMAKVSRDIVVLIHDIHFLPEQIDRFGSRLKELKRMLEERESVIAECQARFNRSVDELRQMHRMVCENNCDEELE